MHDFKAISNMLSSFAMKGQDLARAGTGIQNNAQLTGTNDQKGFDINARQQVELHDAYA